MKGVQQEGTCIFEEYISKCNHHHYQPSIKIFLFNLLKVKILVTNHFCKTRSETLEGIIHKKDIKCWQDYDERLVA